MRTTIQIKGLQVYGYHGIFEEERRLGQKFVFDIDADLVPVATHDDDRLDASVRYDAMAGTIVEMAGGAAFHTLEALAEAIARGLMHHFPAIDAIAIGVWKANPPIPHMMDRIGVSIALSRAEMDAGDQRAATDASARTRA